MKTRQEASAQIKAALNGAEVGGFNLLECRLVVAVETPDGQQPIRVVWQPKDRVWALVAALLGRNTREGEVDVERLDDWPESTQDGEWLYHTISPLAVGIRGCWEYDDEGFVVFKATHGDAHDPSDFEAGEYFTRVAGS